MTTHRATLTEHKQFRLMRTLESTPDVSRSDMAKAWGVSFGGISYCLNALVDKSLVEIRNFSQNQNKFAHVYLPTPRGIAEEASLTSDFAKRKMNEYDSFKVEIATLKSKTDLEGVEYGASHE